MEEMNILLLLLPVVLIQLALMIFALVDLSKNSNPNGPKWMWALIIILINLVGPIVYFVIGRRNY